MKNKKIKKIGKTTYLFIIISMVFLFLLGLIVTLISIYEIKQQGFEIGELKMYIWGPLLLLISFVYIFKAMRDIKELGYFKKENKNSKNS